MEFKAATIEGTKFTIYISPMADPKRLRGMLGLSGVRDNDKPAEFIAQLTSQGVKARVEPNACGECELFCQWNDCFSMPAATLEKVLEDMWKAAERLYGPCRRVEINPDYANKYSIYWVPVVRRLTYVQFGDTGNTERLIARLGDVHLGEVTPIKQLGTSGLRIILVKQVDLSVALQRLGAAIAPR